MKFEKIGGEVVLPNGKVAPLSKAIKCNGVIYCSGQLAFRQDGTLCTGSIEEQTSITLNNIKTLLDESGLKIENLVRLTVWLKNVEDYNLFNKAYIEFMGDHRPVRSVVRSDLMIEGATVEIEATAVEF